jgi:hypothetical protein
MPSIFSLIPFVVEHNVISFLIEQFFSHSLLRFCQLELLDHKLWPIKARLEVNKLLKFNPLFQLSRNQF